MYLFYINCTTVNKRTQKVNKSAMIKGIALSISAFCSSVYFSYMGYAIQKGSLIKNRATKNVLPALFELHICQILLAQTWEDAKIRFECSH